MLKKKFVQFVWHMISTFLQLLGNYSELNKHRDWPDTHCGTIYCSLDLPAASLLSIPRLATGRPRLQQMAPQCVSSQSLIVIL